MAIDFTDYDRITDILIYFSRTITLNFNVRLSMKDTNGYRQFFQYETEFTSKYNGVNIGRSVKRNMSYYFTIDDKEDFTNSLVLRPQDVTIILMLIEKRVIPWFIGNKRIFDFVEDGKRLTIKGKYSPVVYTQSELKGLFFEPIVFTYEDGTFKEGVRLTLNSNSFADVDLDRFLGFYYTLKNTDMYSAACALVNYVKTPPYGINIYSNKGLGSGGNLDSEAGTNFKQQNYGGKRTNSFLDSANSNKKGDS
jgi:hypothetical protein